MRAGPWLRLCALGASAAGVLAVASAELGIAHRALVGVAVPFLVAMVLGSWFAHRDAFVLSSAALVVFLAAVASWWASTLHLALAGAALATTVIATARRGSPPPRASTAATGLRRWRGATTSR